MTQLYASIPYNIQIGEEKYFQTIFYVTFKLVGTDILVEQATNIGRLDAIVQTLTTCLIVEFKIHDSAMAAIEQIENKKYYQPYLLMGKKIVFVGVKFDITLKNVAEVEWKDR